MSENNSTHIIEIEDQSQFYAYPMAAAFNGSAVESEYNIRSLMSCMFNKSACKSEKDFIIYYQSAGGVTAEPLASVEAMNWYQISNNNMSIGSEEGVYPRLYIGTGEGECNGYYVKVPFNIDFHFEGIDITQGIGETKRVYYAVLGVKFTSIGLADGLEFSLVRESDYADSVAVAKGKGLLDTGIRIGEFTVNYGNETTCTYRSFPQKTTCLSIEKIGDATSSFEDYLYNRLQRLYELSIDNGELKVGTVVDSSFTPDPAGEHHDFSMISNYKIVVGLSKPENSNDDPAYYIGIGEENNGIFELKDSIIKCKAKIEGTSVSFHDIEMFGGSVESVEDDAGALDGFRFFGNSGSKTEILKTGIKTSKIEIQNTNGSSVKTVALDVDADGELQLGSDGVKVDPTDGTLIANRVYGVVWM